MDTAVDDDIAGGNLMYSNTDQSWRQEDHQLPPRQQAGQGTRQEGDEINNDDLQENLFKCLIKFIIRINITVHVSGSGGDGD